LAPSREAARALIERSAVLVSGTVADKPARLVAGSEPVVILDAAARRFVSRGGDKLDAALDRFALDVTGRRCVDAGASTGGFTHCLLERGAASVVAVDVGHGQFDASLRAHRRVTLLERTDVRALSADTVGGPVDLVVADLSFISLVPVVPVLVGTLASPGADVVVLVKPQFEAGRVEASRGRGVIRRPALRRQALARVASALTSHGASIMGAMASPVLGPAGNAEFFLHARTGAPGAGAAAPGDGWDDMVDAALATAPDAAEGRADASDPSPPADGHA
jgi:23S rRNA (cytidine1920-2'-O)/16S rRNA (cytidine1409-2'-O)-methyltransferase